MAEPMTEEELQDLRARVERVPLCYQREADTTIERLLATVNDCTGGQADPCRVETRRVTCARSKPR